MGAKFCILKFSVNRNYKGNEWVRLGMALKKLYSKDNLQISIFFPLNSVEPPIPLKSRVWFITY